MNEYTVQKQIVLSAIARGAHTLQEIACECGGIYPRELLSLIEELILSKQVVLLPQGYYIPDYTKTPSRMTSFQRSGGYPVELPEPHPHDYDWRFDTATAQRLANLAKQQSFPRGKILLLGTPSVFIELVYTHTAPQTTLLDWSRALIDYLAQFHLPNSFALVEHNLLSGQLWHGASQVDVVLCDPPWYIEYYAAFLAQAAYVARLGARIAVSLLPTDTRPRAVADRWKIFSIAHKLGLHLLSIESGLLRYETPIFERASLHSASIDINKNWRVGDLVTFSKVNHPSWDSISGVLSFANSMIVDTHEWAEILLGRYKVKLRGPFDDYTEKPELLSIEQYDTLPTVSRRYKGRESIDLWLWNNRVFAVKGRAAFLAALKILNGSPIPDTLQQVPEHYLRQALTLLVHSAGVVDFQTNEVLKVTKRGRKHGFTPYGIERGTGTT